ncbi:hypothetical protein B0O99DRAFT_681354 [Bisporella sp. PMI_857]|nr:hypothetical protein B0O99DRAFT_681354 [Bisporella sp. PMI_857]
MLSLWFVAAKTRSTCRCHSCLNAATTISRRATTAPAPRRLRYGDLFTACYSTILGTAVFVDAKAKEDRSREWDRLIAEMKAVTSNNKLGAPETTSLSEESTLGNAQIGGRNFLSSSEDLVSFLPSEGTWWANSRLAQLPEGGLRERLSTLASHIKQATTVQGSPVGKGSKIDGFEEETTFIDDEDPGGLYPHREPSSRIHIRRLEGMVSLLVTRLLYTARICSLSRGTKDNSVEFRRMSDRIEGLQHRRTQLPEYVWPDDESVQKERDGLHAAFMKLDRGWTQDANLELMIAKICYNLLICTAPPSIQTYNALLKILLAHEQPELSQVLVDSFLEESKFKANPRWVHLMLLHYIAKRDQAGFLSIISRMNAVNGQDLRLKRRSPADLYMKKQTQNGPQPLMPHVREWKNSRPTITRKDPVRQRWFLHEMFVPSPEIYDTMLRGFLEFKMIRDAVGLAHNLIERGVEINSVTLKAVISYCQSEGKASRLHFGAPNILLSILRQFRQQWMTGTIPSDAIYRDVEGRHAMYRMIQLVRSTDFKMQHWARTAWKIFICHKQLSRMTDGLEILSNRISSVEASIIAGERKPLASIDQIADTAKTSADTSLVLSNTHNRSLEDLTAGLKELQKHFAEVQSLVANLTSEGTNHQSSKALHIRRLPSVCHPVHVTELVSLPELPSGGTAQPHESIHTAKVDKRMPHGPMQKSSESMGPPIWHHRLSAPNDSVCLV